MVSQYPDASDSEAQIRHDPARASYTPTPHRNESG
jgi:hypothetical protein